MLPATQNKKSLTAKQELFLDYLFSDEVAGDVRKAMDLAGYSKNTPPADVLRNLTTEVVTRTQNLLKTKGPEAVFAVLDVMRNGDQLGSSNKLKAAQDVLNRSGITESSGNISLSVPRSGIAILPMKDVDKEELFNSDNSDSVVIVEHV